MPRIVYQSLSLLTAAFKSRDDARRDSSRPNALTLDSLAAIVMAAAACEAFINELGEYIPLYGAATRDWAPIPQKLVDCGSVLARLESERSPVALKYLVASLILSGSMFNSGEAPMQAFEELLALRNSVMHLKPSDKSGPKRAEALAQRGEAYPVEPGWNMHWLDRLETPQTAEWACATARAIILAVLAMIPDASSSTDNLYYIKQAFRDDNRFPP